MVLQASNIEVQSVLGVGARYHHPLPRVFAAVLRSEHEIKDPHARSLLVKPFIDTKDPHGLVLSTHVFGKLPSIIKIRGRNAQSERLSAIAAAKDAADRILRK